MNTKPPYFKRSVCDFFDRVKRPCREDVEDDTTRALRIVLEKRECKEVEAARMERQRHQQIIKSQALKLEECRAANPVLFARPGDEIDFLHMCGTVDIVNSTYVGRANMVKPLPNVPGGLLRWFQMEKRRPPPYGFQEGEFIVLAIWPDTPPYWRKTLFEVYGWEDHGDEYLVVDSKYRRVALGPPGSSLLVLHTAQTTNRRIARVGSQFNQWAPHGPENPQMPFGMSPYAELYPPTESGSSSDED